MNCFVIQPFDCGKYDKRFKDVFKPGILNARLQPYRVDCDPSAAIPIESIEENIRASAICFAEISTDNPNVWFELGYSFAAGKPVVMVCSDERITKFPFDIQHRAVIKYSTESKRDYTSLRGKITERLNSYMEKFVIGDHFVAARMKLDLAFTCRSDGKERDAYLLEQSTHEIVERAAEMNGQFYAAAAFLSEWAQRLRQVGRERDAYHVETTASRYRSKAYEEFNTL